MSPRSWAFYGHRGVGTTTVVSNLSAALAEAGRKVLQISCNDPDATAALRGNHRPQSAPVVGFKGVLTLEIGTDAGELSAELERLDREELIARAAPDFVLYELSGKGGRELLPLLDTLRPERVIAVVSAEAAALRSCNALCRLLAERSFPAAVIGNRLTDPLFSALIEDFSRRVAVPALGLIPHALTVTRSAFFGETVIEAAPLAHQAYLYRAVARRLAEAAPPPADVPLPLSEAELHDWIADWGDRLYDLGEGLVSGGGAI